MSCALVTWVGAWLVGVAAAGSVGGYHVVTPTVGTIWPKPQMQLSTNSYMVLRTASFKFKTIGHTCDIVDAAIKRYTTTLRSMKSQGAHPWRKDAHFRGYLDVAAVNLLTACETTPHFNMDEHYQIKVDSPDAPQQASIISQSVWGILRGLESFTHLLVPNGAAFTVNSTQVMDFPRFPYRGLMLDTSRHFLPLNKILETLDLMAINKFNVFHWHIVDDQSFPYQSAKFPALSGLGAFTSSHVYTEDQIQQVVEYARLRGIRLLAEFDTPGHTQSWGPGQPGLLTPCYSGSSPDGTFGPVDPTNDANYEFLKEFFTEATQRFPDHYVHLGGDEVDFTCWKSNPNITAFMAAHNLTEYSQLEGYYVAKLLDIINNLPTKNGYLVWQEVFDNGVQIAADTVVHVWKGENSPTLYKETLEKVTGAGYQAVLSSCWYLNYISYGVDWHKYYQCDPHDFNGTDAMHKLVMGGEACMWGEYVDRTNLIPRTWPRASVVAEKLWSSASHTNDTDAATPRLEEHRCRMLARGYDVEPLWPSYCAADLR